MLKPDALVQLCMGVPWGAPDDLNTFMAMVNNVPSDWTWSAFSIGRNQMAYVAAAVLAGGNVRVGLEDNLWLDKGVLATNAQLVERAVTHRREHGRAGHRPRRGAQEAQPRRSGRRPAFAESVWNGREPCYELKGRAMKTVKFTAMKDGDREDYEFLTAHEIDYAAKTGDRLLDALVQLDEGLSGYKITRLGHSLQAATRAWRDGADTDWIACALLHDIGDIYAPYNHDEYAAAILKPSCASSAPGSWKSTAISSASITRIISAATARARPVRRPRLFRRLRPVLRALGPVELRSRTTTRCRSNSSGPSCSRCSPARPTIPPSSAPASASR